MGQVSPQVPRFPPNRVIREGEPTCRICGSGYSTHDDGTRFHRYEGTIPLKDRLGISVALLLLGSAIIIAGSIVITLIAQGLRW